MTRGQRAPQPRAARAAVVACLFWCQLFSGSYVQAANGREGGLLLRGGVGAAQGKTTVANTTADRAGICATIQVGFAFSRVRLLVDLTHQPFDVENPQRAEAFHVSYVLASVEVSAGPIYARGGIGPASYSFSGQDVFVARDTGLGVGAALGYEVTRGRIRPSIEVFGRWGVTSDVELKSRLLGVQLTASWYRHSRP